MNQTKFLAFAVICFSLNASDRSFYSSIQVDQAKFKSQTITGTFDADPVPIRWANQYQADYKVGLGICFGFTPWKSIPSEFDVELGYRINTESALRSLSQPDLGRYSLEYYSIGGVIRFKNALGLGIGLDFRRETLGVLPYTPKTGWIPASATQIVTIYRPWAMISLTHEFFSGESVQPFVAARAGVALTKYDAPKGSDSSTPPPTDQYISAWTRKFARSLAPTFQIAIQSGIRF